VKRGQTLILDGRKMDLPASISCKEEELILACGSDTQITDPRWGKTLQNREVVFLML
jgi:hypothetical protein